MEPLDNLAISSEDRRETGDIDQFDPKLIPLQSNSYLGQFLVWFDFLEGINSSINCFIFCCPGFSIDSGMALLRKGELTIVSGAPRGGYSGQVAFLRADPMAQGNLSVELVLSHSGLASSFGYDVAVVDFNGDG